MVPGSVSRRAAAVLMIAALLCVMSFTGLAVATDSNTNITANETVEADAFVGTQTQCAGVGGDPCWQSFQDALDFLDDGDTLFMLHGGVFEESAVVENNNVRIIGDGDVDTGLFWQPTESPSSEPTLKIEGDGVTLEQFGVDRAPHPERDTTSPTAAAIEVKGADVEFNDVSVNGFIRDWDETNLMQGSEVPAADRESTSTTKLTGITLTADPGETSFEETEVEGFETGVAVESADQVEINRSLLTTNQVGMEISDSQAVSIQNTAFVNNSDFGVKVIDEPNEPVAATENWWGSASGPSGVGPGSGDAVSEGVEYQPWSETAPTAITATVQPRAVVNNDLPQTVTVEVNLRGTATAELENLPEEWTVTDLQTDSNLANDPMAAYSPGDETVYVEFEEADPHELTFDIEVGPGLVTLERDLIVSATGEDGVTRSTAVSLSLANTNIESTVDYRGTPMDATVVVDIEDADDIVLDELPEQVVVGDFRYPNVVGEPMARYEPGDEVFAIPFGFRSTHRGVTFDLQPAATPGIDPYDVVTHEFVLRAGVAGETTAESDMAVSLPGGQQRLGTYASESGTVDINGIRTGIGDWRAGTLEITQLRTIIDYWRSGTAIAELTVTNQTTDGSTITTDGATYAGAEWGIVIHEVDASGERTRILAVSDTFAAGETVDNYAIPLEEPISEETQIAVTLHTPGEDGEYVGSEAAWLSIGEEALTETVSVTVD